MSIRRSCRVLLAVLLGSLLLTAVTATPASAVRGYRVSWTYSQGLNVRSGPTTGDRVVTNLRDGTAVDLECWARGSSVGGNTVWYRIASPAAGYVTSAYINTPSDPLPGLGQCGAGGSSGGRTGSKNGYPYPNAPDCNENTGASCAVDAWSFYQGQCTSYVAHMLRQRGVSFTNSYRQPSGYRWGNAGQWQHAARRSGFAVDGTPRVGDVGEFNYHVVYVHEVRSDGSIVYSDMNSDYHNGFRGSVVARRGTAAWPLRFLHIG